MEQPPLGPCLLGREHGVVVPVRVDPSGRRGPTPRRAAGPGWRRTSRGFYVPAGTEPTPAQRVAEAGVLLPAERAAVTGWAALCWYGSRWHTGIRPDGTPVPVDVSATRRALRPQPLLRLREERNDIHGFELVDGLSLVPPVVAVTFLMRYSPSVAAAVEALDMTYRADLVTLDEVDDWVTEHPSYVGIQRARDALPLADENAWSPQETHLRLAWEHAIGVRPLANQPVFDLTGHHLGTPDLIDPTNGVCGEYDGDHHLERRQRRDDLARQELMQAHGLEPFTVVAGDLRSGAFHLRLRSAYRRAARIPATDRRWTLRPPPWWRPTTTVAQRRALDDPGHADRGQWLPRTG